VRRASLGKATRDEIQVLTRLGFTEPDGSLTPRGRSFDDVRWVFNRSEEALPLIAEGFLGLSPTQALIQAFRGKGPVPLEGAFHFLVRHKLAEESDIAEFRAFLRILNGLDIVTYSNKKQTLRVVTEMVAMNEDAEEPLVRVIEPDRPFSNVRHVREILRGCDEYIWWVDAHFSRAGLEPLADEVDGARIKEIRILSGAANAGDKARKDFERFKTEMAALGVAVEWRVVDRADVVFHDRFILTKGKAWNGPPINTVFTGKYSELGRTNALPPFEDWWIGGTTLPPP
jgi:hypothetical protein